MKMRQKLIAVLAASMVATSLPVVTMADTTNYVSSAHYAKKGSTYGYTATEVTNAGVKGTKVTGVNNQNTYEGFNGFEFSPIMTYTQGGTMFMSLTDDTSFDAQAILTYVDSFNFSTAGGVGAATNLWVDESGTIHGANNTSWNGKKVENIIAQGVDLEIHNSSSNEALPAESRSLADYVDGLQATIEKEILDEIAKKSPDYYVAKGDVKELAELVNIIAKEVVEKIHKEDIEKLVKLTPDALKEKVKNMANDVTAKIEQDYDIDIDGHPITTAPITTASAFYKAGGQDLSLAKIAQKAADKLVQKINTINQHQQSRANQRHATITIKKVESFTVEDADGRKYNSHLRVDFSGSFNKNITYKVPLLAKIGGDKQVILNVDGKDSFVTSGKYSLTQDAVTDKRLTATADSAKIRPNYAEAIGEIKLTETEAGALIAGDTQKNKEGIALGEYSREIKLTLPSSSGLEFNLEKTKRNLTMTGKRGFYGKVADDKNKYDEDHVADHGTYKHEQLPTDPNSTTNPGLLDYARYERRNDTEENRQTLIITLPSWVNNAKGELALNGIFVQPIDESAPTGDVNITISEYIDSKDYRNVTNPARNYNDVTTNLIASTTLKVAEVKEYDIALTCEKPVDIKAGRSGIINNKTVTFTLEESVKDSLADGRRITFELENGYLFGAADIMPEVKYNANGNVISGGIYTTTGYKEAAEARFKKLVADDVIQLKINGKGKSTDKTKNVEFNVADLKLIFDAEGRVIGFSTIYNELSETVADKIEMTIPVATSVMSTGEVKVVAKNLTTRSFQDKEDPSAVIAKIATPIEVTFDGAKLKVGLQAQEAGSITIKETDKGMLERGWLFLTADINSGITFDKVPTVTIQSEDGKEVKVTNVALNKGRTVLGLEVSKTSLEASTIKISDVVLTADRTVPEANYDLVMWGSALTDESVRDIYEFDRRAVNTYSYFGEGSDVYKVKEFVQMTTKNTEDITDSNNKAVTASFVIGESKFTVNGEEVAMDSAAYVKNGYTFVPVKYVAKAFGIEGNAVQYDKATSTATIIAGNKVINITNGKPFIVVNGTQVPMAVKAEVKEGRMCVPMAYIAAALDVQKSWDATTKTATFTNVTEAKAPAAEASTK